VIRRPHTRRLLALIQIAAGGLAVALGLTVVLGWQTGSALVMQARSGGPAMQYITALAFAVAGMGLLAAVSRRDGVAGISGLLIAAIGILSFAQHLLLVDPAVDLVFGATASLTPAAHQAARMLPNTAICFALVGVALFLRRAGGTARMSMATSVLGSATVALGLVGLIGHATDPTEADGWGRLTRMGVHAAGGFVIVGSGLVARGWRDAHFLGVAAQRLPALVGVASLTATIAIWQALVVHDRLRTFELIRIEAEYLRAAIAGPLEAHVGALERLALRERPTSIARADWRADAAAHLGHYGPFHSIERIDLDSSERWRVPDHVDATLLVAQLPERSLMTALATGATLVSGAVDLTDGQSALIVVAPAPRAALRAAGVVGVVRVDRLVGPALAGEEKAGFRAAVFDGLRRVYGAEDALDVSGEWIAAVDIGVRGASLRLRLWPTAARLAQLEGRLPSLILAGGLVLSAVLTCMTFFAGMSRRRERQLREAARQLREQMTEREIAQQALRESEERYRGLVDSASDIIYRVDPRGTFTFVNPVGARVMKRPQSALVGAHFLELVQPDWRAEVERVYAEQIAQRTNDTYFEFPAVTGDGDTVWIGQNVQLILEDDTIVGLQAVARDITERRRADAELARARDAALESDRLKSEFVANVSHELRTPMNGILGFTELLLASDLTPEQRDYVATVRDCGETLLVLLNDILDLSKVAAGKLEIQTIAFEPRRLLQQTTDLFQERARRKGIDLVSVVHHEVPEMVEGDPARLRQVLTNLLGNAVKFTEEGEITVRLSVDASGGPGAALRCEVADTGIGIAPDAPIFQPFVQADGSITRKYGGTGLGLVISRQLAELMGGEMGMTSELGKGSTFWFTVRVGVVAAAPRPKRLPDVSLRGVRVLVLDDADSSRQRLRQLLEERELVVAAEDTSDGALRSLERAAADGEPFDVILVDLHEPGSSILAFAEAVHSAGFVPPARLVLISRRGEPGDAQRAQRLGASAYLTNPTPADLFVCLATVMAAPAPGNGPAAPPPLVTRYTLEPCDRRAQMPLLVVEDNLVNQKVLLGMLGKLGYRADVASDGYEALDALQRIAYPLVLMDSQMPGLDGFATTARLRQLPGAAGRTVIVAVTAHAMTGERERCLAAGMDDYLSKPVSLDRLSSVLDRWLGMTDTDGAPRAAEAGNEPIEVVPTLDAQALSKLRELESEVPGLVGDVVSTFFAEAPGRLERLRACAAAGDLRALEAAAHGLRGSAGAVGARRLAELCARIEAGASRGTIQGCLPIVAILPEEYRRLRGALQDAVTPGDAQAAV
jgi:PAS domain S-box-containing protein